MSFLPNEDYETFVLTVINGKQSLSYNEISSALVNHELRMKEKGSFKSTSAETLMIGSRSSSRKDKCIMVDQSLDLIQGSEEQPVCLLQKVIELEG